MLRVDRPLVGFLCQVVLSDLLQEYAQVERRSRCSLRVLRVDRLLISFHCTSVLALPIKDGTPEKCCPRLSLSGSPLNCILAYRTLRLAGGLSGRFFRPLTRFVSGVHKVVIALIEAFLMWRSEISQIC